RGPAPRARSLEVATHLVRDRHGQQHRHRQRKQPPPVVPVVRGDVDTDDGEDHADRDSPVVADDEVVPEPSELRELAHEVTTPSRCCSRRRYATSPNTVTTTNAMTASSAASLPGHAMPAPSELQKIPNAVSITPTPNSSVWYGARVS